MKKNLLLFGTLAGLLLITYFFQEKKSQDAFTGAQTRDQIIGAPIETLSLPAGELTKRDESWYAGETLLSHNLMKQLERKLTEVKRTKTITGGEWGDYFPGPLSFTVNGTSYTLGEMSLDRKGFYIARDKTIMLARIEGENQELTTDEAEIDAIKLKELKQLLQQDLAALKERQLFRFYGKLPLNRAILSLEDRLDFELDLRDNHTVPPPFPGVSVHEKLQEKFLSLFTQLTLKEEVPFPKSPLVKRLGSLTLSGDGDESLHWELWLRSAKSADVLILDPKNQRAFDVIGGTVKLFFTGLQDYWDKKAIPAQEFRSFQRLPLTFRQGQEEGRVFVVNSEPLRFESGKHKVQEAGMNELLRFLFGLPPRDQAQRVSPLTKSEKKSILAGDYLRVRVWDEEILFWDKGQELILVNLTRGFKAHYLKTEISSGFGFKDVLK